jgi:putative membrane protein
MAAVVLAVVAVLEVAASAEAAVVSVAAARREDGDMSIIKQTDLDAVSQAIKDAEQNTDAELVAVLARRADDYRYIPTLWAALIGLISPSVVLLVGLWLTTTEILMLQATVFVVLALVLRIPAIMYRLIPRSVRQWRAQNLARRQFLENNLHHTAAESGVLVFVSEAEHYVEIIADRGISQFVSQDQWQSMVDSLTAAIKSGDTTTGLVNCITACGDVLAEHIPATSEKNELPNHLIVL